MLNNLLLQGMTTVQTGLFTFLLGMIVTFFGMFLLVACVSLTGKLLSAKDKKAEDGIMVLPELSEENPVYSEDDDEIPEDVKVAIIAAVTAYYVGAKAQNEFVVRKIKRIK